MDRDDQKVGGLLADYLHISRPQLIVLLSPPNQSLGLEVSDPMHFQHTSQSQTRREESTGTHPQACTMVSVSVIIIAANDHPTA